MSLEPKLKTWLRMQWENIKRSFRLTSPLDHMPINWDAVEADFVQMCDQHGLNTEATRRFIAEKRKERGT